MRSRLLTLEVLFVVFSLPTLCAQPDTLHVSENFSSQRTPGWLSFFESGKISSDSAWQVFRKHPKQIQKFVDNNIGIVANYFWFAAFVKNDSERPKQFYFVVEHPHLRRLGFYEWATDSLENKFETGYQKSFNERLVPHRHFVFPFTLQAQETKGLLLLVDQENSLNLPISLWDQSVFNEYHYTLNFFIGLGFGFVMLCTVFALLATLLLRKLLFFWYFFYLLSAIFFGFTDLGFSSQYLFPSVTYLEGPLSIHSNIYPLIFLIKFSQELLGSKVFLTKIHNALNLVFYFLISIVLIDWVLGDTWREYAFYFLPLLYVMMLSGLALLIASGIYSLKTNRQIAVLYLSASGMVIITALVTVPQTVFGISDNWSNFNPVLLGYLMEIIFLTLALIVQYQQIQNEKRRLELQLNEQQQQMYKTYIDGIEKERGRIAGELHDDIGSRLSNIKQMMSLQKENAESTAQKLDGLIADIRRISHDLAPPSAHISGLRPLVEQLVIDIQKATTVEFRLKFFDYEERFRIDEIHQVYRIIQEAVQNIVRHAHANRADIQFFGYQNELVIAIEDNGRGFDLSEKSLGIGLTQMKIRCENLKARIEIDSRPGNGCHLLIQIPYH